MNSSPNFDEDKERRKVFRKRGALTFMGVLSVPVLIGVDQLSNYLGIMTYRGAEGLLFCGGILWFFLVVVATRCVMYLKFGAIARQDVIEAVEKSRQTMHNQLGAEAYEGWLYYRREIGMYWIAFVSVFVPAALVGLVFMGLGEGILEDLRIAGCVVVLSLMFAWLVAIIKTRKKYPGSMEKIRALYRSPSNFKG